MFILKVETQQKIPESSKSMSFINNGLHCVEVESAYIERLRYKTQSLPMASKFCSAKAKSKVKNETNERKDKKSKKRPKADRGSRSSR